MYPWCMHLWLIYPWCMYHCTGEYLCSQNTTRFFQYPKSTSEEGAAVAWFCCLSMCAKRNPCLQHSFSKISSSWIVEKFLRKYRRHYYLLQTLSSLRSSGALMLSSSPHSFDHNGQCFCVSVFLLPKIFFVGTIAISWSLWPISVIWITPSRWTKRYQSQIARCNYILL